MKISKIFLAVLFLFMTVSISEANKNECEIAGGLYNYDEYEQPDGTETCVADDLDCCNP